MGDTIIFGADWCRDCRRVKILFDHVGAPYRYVDLDATPAAIEIAKDISGRSAIPVIVFPDRSHQVVPSSADLLRKIDELGLRTVPNSEPTHPTVPTAPAAPEIPATAAVREETPE